MPDALGDQLVSCTFVRRRRTGDEIEQVNVAVPFGTSAWRIRLRSACHDFATERSCQLWAMPHLVHDAPGDWLVYEHNTGGEQSPVFLKRLPTRNAAEMWMLHDAA